MATEKKSGYSTDDEEEWNTGKYQHISDEDTDDEDDGRRAAAIATPAVPSATMDESDPAREELDGLLQNIKLKVAKYILKEYKLNYVDRENLGRK